MEKNNKLVSVVIPCYNQSDYLPETLDSLINQSYKNWEGIIVNDGSPDNTEEVALTYLKKDKRLKYFRKANGGLSSARNYGIECALGDFILPLDSDDIIKPEYLEKAVDAFEKDPSLKLVYCLGYCFGVTTGLWDLVYIDYKSLLLRNSIFCSAMYRKRDWAHINGYDEQMLKGFEDWEFFIRLLNDDSKVYQIPVPLFYYRTKSVSMVTATRTKEARMDLEDYIFLKHKDKYIFHFGGVFDAYRELIECRKKIDRYKNKWYRRLFYKYVKANLNKIGKKS